MDSLLQDLRYGLRMLMRNPGFTTVAVLALALGIGANTAIFSVINAVLLRPLPFKDSSRLVELWEHNYKRNTPGSAGHGRNVLGPRNFIKWRERNQVFDSICGFFQWQVNLTGDGEPERVPIAYVTPNLLSTLGVNAKAGRILLPEDEATDRGNPVVVSEAFWKGRFAGERAAIGKTVKLDADTYTIVGVVDNASAFPAGTDIWVPWHLGERFRNAGGRYMSAIAHLKPGVSVEQAQAHMSALASQIEKEDPAFDTGWNALVVPLREQIVGDIRLPLLVLISAVGFVLLICCANVANLLLARASVREREMAIRAALGVRRSRLIRQLLTESLLLALLGGAAGLGIAYWGLSGLLAIVPAELPTYTAITISGPVLGFTLGIALLTGLVFGLAPALRVSAFNPVESLKEGGKGLSSSRHRLRDLLVVAEAALTLLLLVGAGLLLKSFVRLLQTDPGFRPDHLLTAQINRVVATRPGEPDTTPQFYQQVVDRIRALAGVQSVGAISWLPLDSLGSATSFTVDDRPVPAQGEQPTADVRFVTDDYFRAMGIPLLRGRSFDSGDRAGDAVKKVVVNETLAKTYWPGENALGKHLTMPWFDVYHGEVVGVISDQRLVTLSANARSQIYWYLPQAPNSFMSIVVRTAGDPGALTASLRAAVASVDANQPVAKIRPMDDVLAASLKQQRFLAALTGSFAVLALVLAAVGIYGVMSYAVTQRTREMGIRMALGATTSQVAGMVIREGMVLALAGIGIGVVASFALTRFLATLLFEVKSSDPLTFAAVSLLLIVIALAAVLIPARRATKVDPMVALRYE